MDMPTKEDLMKCRDKGNGIRTYKHFIVLKEHAIKHSTKDTFPTLEETFKDMDARRAKEDDRDLHLFQTIADSDKDKVEAEMKKIAQAMLALEGVRPEKGIGVAYGIRQNPEELTETPCIRLDINFSLSG